MKQCMRLTALAAVLVPSGITFGSTSSEAQTQGGRPSGTEACFARIKRLAGEWLQKDEKTGKEDVLVRYKITAGGSAVEETLFPGKSHEMVTIYHMDGPNLVLTHYCAAGNQPHLKAAPSSTRKRIEFECAGGTNMKSHEDMHMHHAVLVLPDENHMSAEWTAMQAGKPGHVARFVVTRKH